MECDNITKPRYQDWKRQTHASSSMSPLALWYQTENEKRQKGLLNEIDINEILAALKGFRNAWSTPVQENKELIEKMANEKKFDWEKLQELKSINTKVLQTY